MTQPATPPRFTVDVWFATSRPVGEQDWARFHVSTPDNVEAELAALQWAANLPGVEMPLRAVTVDWDQ